MKRLLIKNALIISVVIVGSVYPTVSSGFLLDESSNRQNERDTIVRSMPYNFRNDLKNADASHIVGISGYKEVLDLFEEYNYTPEVWQKGIREIPRLYISEIGERWGEVSTKKMTVLYKKRIFFRGIAPLVLRANELIMMDRNRLLKQIKTLGDLKSFSEMDQIWIRKLAKMYKVEVAERGIDLSLLKELQKRVDIIPASLALSQAAAESGWGTSDFAAEGNAMYGQWSWGKDAMIPKEQREHLGNYGVAAFKSILESVSAYMLNLNTHYAYADLRNKRSELRKNGDKLSGFVLVDGLIRYSERGESYINTLKSIMEFNKLKPIDDAYLIGETPLYLISVTE